MQVISTRRSKSSVADTVVIDRNPLSLTGLVVGLVASFTAGVIFINGVVMLFMTYSRMMEMLAMESVWMVISSWLVMAFGAGMMFLAGVYTIVKFKRLYDIAFARVVVILPGAPKHKATCACAPRPVAHLLPAA